MLTIAEQLVTTLRDMGIRYIFGVPAAIAAKLCLPERAVACVSGDGGFLMMAGEMATARRLGLNVVFVVLADNELRLLFPYLLRKAIVNSEPICPAAPIN